MDEEIVRLLVTAGISAGTASAVWTAATASRSTLHISREADYKGIQGDLFEHAWQHEQQHTFVIDAFFPIRWWWRLRDNLNPFSDVQLYVGVLFLLDPRVKQVKRVILFTRRRSSAEEVFASLRESTGIDRHHRARFPSAAQHRAAIVRDTFAAFIWPLSDVPRRRKL